MLDLPLQVGIDNSAVVTRAQAILNGKLEHVCWGLARDGDVWQHIHRLLHQRSLSSMRVVK
eukprot:13422968-Alexandrium_andersonii.AAC.1